MFTKIKKSPGILLILATFITLYCHSLNVFGFFHDGYLYAALGKNFPWTHYLIPSMSNTLFLEFTHHPPFFFILEGVFFKIFGSDFPQARLFGLTWIFLTLILFYSFIRKEKGKNFALYSAILLLIIPGLMKKARFPNMDLALLFTYFGAMAFYYKATLSKSPRDWIISGIFCGLGFLIKGISGFLILPIIFMHQLFLFRSLKFLLCKRIWLGLLSFLIVSSIWPILLYMTGRFDIFLNYLSVQFVDTAINGREVVTNDYFLYLKYLCKNSPHLIILLLTTGILIYKRKLKIDKFLCFNFISLFTYIFLLSLMKFKYSHYLIPIYTSLSICSAYSLAYFLKNKNVYFIKVWGALLTIGFIALFPLGISNKVRRDRPIFNLGKKLKHIEEVPRSWVIVENSYSFWALSQLSAYVYGANPQALKISEIFNYLNKITNSSVFIIKSSLLDERKRERISKKMRLLHLEDNVEYWVSKKESKSYEKK